MLVSKEQPVSVLKRVLRVWGGCVGGAGPVSVAVRAMKGAPRGRGGGLSAGQGDDPRDRPMPGRQCPGSPCPNPCDTPMSHGSRMGGPLSCGWQPDPLPPGVRSMGLGGRGACRNAGGCGRRNTLPDRWANDVLQAHISCTLDKGGGGHGCIRREGFSEGTPEALRQAVGGGCQSGWGRLLSVTNKPPPWGKGAGGAGGGGRCGEDQRSTAVASGPDEGCVAGGNLTCCCCCCPQSRETWCRAMTSR